jgi:hypothetical protein
MLLTLEESILQGFDQGGWKIGIVSSPALALLCSPWVMWEQCGPMSLHNPGQLSLFLSMFLSYANPVVLVLYSTPFCSDLVSYHSVCHCFDLNQRVQRFIVPSIIDRYCLSIHRCP